MSQVGAASLVHFLALDGLVWVWLDYRGQRFIARVALPPFVDDQHPAFEETLRLACEKGTRELAVLVAAQTKQTVAIHPLAGGTVGRG